MYKLLLTIGFVAGLVACNKHDAKIQQTDPAQPVTQAAAPAPANSPPAYTASTEPDGTAPAQQPAVEPAPSVAIPAGTHIRVRLEQTVDTKRNRPGDHFEATLIFPIQVDGNILVPRGTQFEGHVTEAKHSGRFKGRAGSASNWIRSE